MPQSARTLFDEEVSAASDLFDQPRLDPELANTPERRTRYTKSIGEEIVGELVKSYGFKQDRSTGFWGWSTDNVAEAFGESPFWTSFDLLTTAVPVVRWGRAAAAIKYGVGARKGAYYAQAFRAGEVSFREAAKLHFSSPATGRIGRLFESSASKYVDPKLVEKYGTDAEWELRGLGYTFLRERQAEEGAAKAILEDIARRNERLAPNERVLTQQLLEARPGTPESRQLWDQLSVRGQELFLRQSEFRTKLHMDAYNEGLLGEETFRRGLESHPYRPHLYEEYIHLFEKRTGRAYQRMKAGGTAEDLSGGERFFTKREDHPELTQILDPALTQKAMTRAYMVVSKQRWANKIARSRLMADESTLLDRTGFSAALADPAAKLAMARKLFPGWSDARLSSLSDSQLKAAHLDNVLTNEGWKRFGEIVPGKNFRPTNRLRMLERAQRSSVRAMQEHAKDSNQLEDIFTSAADRVSGIQMRAGLKLLTERSHARVLRELGMPDTEPALRAVRAGQKKLDSAAELRRLVDSNVSVRERLRRVMFRRGNRLEAAVDRVDGLLAKERERNRIGYNNTFLRHMPDDLLDKFVDPIAHQDIRNSFELLESNPILQGWGALLRTFKINHTAYNPATQVRNFLGNAIFHSFATGLNTIRGPWLGVRELQRGGEYYRKALWAGVLGTSFNAELTSDMAAKFAGRGTEQMLGGGLVRKLLSSTTGKLREIYSASDDVWKLDAFIRNHRKLVKAGLSDVEATEKATLEVLRFMPNFGSHSGFVNAMRLMVPFASFPSEAARVWKNALTYKPWTAFFWSHLADTANQMVQQQMGVSDSEVEAAQSALPWYTQGRRMLMLPFRDGDGKLSFWDLSYIIPLADFGAEAQLSEQTFFNVPLAHHLFDPTSNPMFGAAASFYMGVDPLSGRPVEPRFMEQQLGIPVPPEGRRVLGATEYILRAMLPPLAPPGYAGTNLIELMRQQKSGATGLPMEHDTVRSLFTNLLGQRTFEPTVHARILNLRRDIRQRSEKTTQTWDRFEWAMANGSIRSAEEERKRIVQLRGVDYFIANYQSHMPGSYSNLPPEALNDVLARAAQFRAAPQEMAAVYNRYIQLLRRQR